ncbi:MAG: integrase/recombinase XerD [Thermomicrobiales bacterium]|nr:integrase/recombinase XerD [Thermomicrobiales bacterium]
MPTNAPTAGTTRLDSADKERPKRRASRRLDGVTAAERDQPFTDNPQLLAREQAAADALPDQLQLFTPGPGGKFAPLLGGVPPLEARSSLDLARAWYRRELEQARRPHNTIESYCYDLVKLEEITGSKPIDRITRSHIADFLARANNRSTRKRRLTSVRRFFRFLIDDARVLTEDPTDGFFPHSIQLRSPVPLFAEEQERFLAAAADDEAWSLPAIWLMLRLGLTRGELLALRRDHVDLIDPEQPVVYVFYEDVTKRGKERKLAGDPEFARIYTTYLEAKSPADLLFPVGFQAVNGMVNRVREAAGITKKVTPETLRHTFAVERAKDGADEKQLLALLGLADDPRNRDSVRRYLKLAEPPL